MLPTTTALDNFVKFHIRTDGDCKKIRRIETAVRGEELYRTFSTAPRELRKALFHIFDYTAWTLLSFRDNQEIPNGIVRNYTEAMTTFRLLKSDDVTNMLATFLDFVKKYVFSIAVQNTEYFSKLPEESPDEAVRTVCDIYRKCEIDVFHVYVRKPIEPLSVFPSQLVHLPDDVPIFLRPPYDPLLILCDAATILL